jgi:hypothetical protein
MRLIHKVGFTGQEIESYRQLVFNNLHKWPTIDIGGHGCIRHTANRAEYTLY